MTTEDTKGKFPPSSGISTNTYDDVIRTAESKHVRIWNGIHSVVLYTAVIAVVTLGVVLVRDLILPTWTSLPILPAPDENTLNKLPDLPSEVWIAILTAPLLAVSGLAWATFHALSSKKSLPRVKADLFGEIGQSKDKESS